MTRDDIIAMIMLINPYAAIRTSGEFVGTNCLFGYNHNRGDRTPSAYISINSHRHSYYYCHGCGMQGFLPQIMKIYVERYPSKSHILEYIKAHEINTFSYSYEDPEQNAFMLHAEYMSAEFVDYGKALKKLFPVKDNITWLQKKGIVREHAYEMLRETPEGLLAFPVLDHNFKCIGIKVRNRDGVTPKYFYSHTFKPRYLFYPEWIVQPGNHDKLILVEGELDALYYLQYGLPALGIYGSSNWNNLKKDRIRLDLRMIDAYNASKVLIIMDDDSAGIHAANKIKSDLQDTCIVKVITHKHPREISESEVWDEFERL